MPSPTTVVNGIRANFGVSDCGQVMGQPNEAALASIEPEGTYEHLAIGVLEEGYTLAYKDTANVDHVKYNVYAQSSGIVCPSAVTSAETIKASLLRDRKQDGRRSDFDSSDVHNLEERHSRYHPDGDHELPSERAFH